MSLPVTEDVDARRAEARVAPLEDERGAGRGADGERKMERGVLLAADPAGLAKPVRIQRPIAAPQLDAATADVAANADELAARDCHADIASYSRTASQIS
eukprot:CAMPEP_0202806098 /NCGR_PEP_ID=MMETSP1388-20130828/104468_1 /ASSEMBLY_ACC=CAM_ASM_000864 /TAXON_ID=37098 /ORGANISM="Isochrysis sp, Strain CCMP1244" /LENGTH=99 /DNA_ID=CAMNT_0049476087 /DNA_START=300 /DNA_END=600 /DNA_ORIENTATION=-